MKNYNTILGQMLQIISRYDFEKSVKVTNAEKSSKGFSSWSHFVSMLFAQLSDKDNLRGIENSINSNSKKLYHLGIQKINKSTLSYANTKRPYQLFENVFFNLLNKTEQLAPKHKFKFNNPLYSIDASTIDLCLSLHDWARFRKTKGGIKLHTKLNHSGYLPSFNLVTNAIEHESNVIDKMNIKSGDVIVFDRGYNKYTLFNDFCKNKVIFVTRLKKNAKYKVIKRNNVKKYNNISSDHIIEFSGFNSNKKCPIKLRKIRSKDPETGKYIIVLTNQLKWSPKTIAQIYKDRWQIEIFFKMMKQKLKIKSFFGTSKNAILTQIWTAMIAYLLLKYLIFKSKYKWTIYKLMSVIPTIIFIRKELWSWLNYPFDDNVEKEVYNKNQLELTF